jgi:ADP-glucose pyrophosphorylase
MDFTICVILAGGIGARYRIIDFTLSNCQPSW